MKVSAAYVKAKIQQNQKHTVLIAEDIGPGNARIAYVVGNAETLCAEIDLLEESSETAYRVRLCTPPRKGVRGDKSTEEKELVWILPGRSAQPAPAAAAPMQYAGPASAPTLAMAEAKGRAEAEAIAARDRIAALEARLQALEEQEDEDGDEDEADEPVNAAPPPPVPWYESEVGKSLVELGKMAAAKLFAPAAPAAPVNAAPVATPTPSDLTEEDMRILIAVKQWKQHDPEQYNQYGRALIDTYAPKTSAHGEA